MAAKWLTREELMDRNFKLLIANRGEIAVRIIRTAARMRLRTVAVYTEEDRASLSVQLADESVFLSGTTLSETYLNHGQLIRIAHDCGVTAIHPGYGFLSENAVFAREVEASGLIFIGARPDQLRLMGEKKTAAAFVQELGIPVIPGCRGSKETILQHKEELDFPVLVKASAGGGGKGMLIVSSPDELAEALDQAGRQAMDYFGNGELMVEQYLPAARHIEVQLMGDGQGEIVHFFERDCSIQRRYQKVIEEAPAVAVEAAVCRELEADALKIGREICYRGAGTIEFLVDDCQRHYFLEMNTRLQVEHPVTELVTGADLVEWQLYVALEGRLLGSQDQIKLTGHAIELRICAEDPVHEFVPVPGVLGYYEEPKSGRWDSFLVSGMSVSGVYDSLLGKLVVHAAGRPQAITGAQTALDELFTGGLTTNQAYLRGLLQLSAFQDNRLTTGFILEHHESIISAISVQKEKVARCLIAAAYLIDLLWKKDYSAGRCWPEVTFRRLSPVYEVEVEGEAIKLLFGRQKDFFWFVDASGMRTVLNILPSSGGTVRLTEDEKEDCFFVFPRDCDTLVQHHSLQYVVKSRLRPEEVVLNKSIRAFQPESESRITAPLFGKVIRVNVCPGQETARDEVLVVLESMKTEFKIHCPCLATVKAVLCCEGDMVRDGELLVELKLMN